MLLTYSLKTGLNHTHETNKNTSSASSGIIETDTDNMQHTSRVSSSLDCWARMIPRQLEDGVPPNANSPYAFPASAATRRRNRPHYRVLYPSSSQPLPSSKETPRPKGVRFAPTERVYSVPSRSSYSTSDRRGTWYTRRDLLAIKTEAGKVVNMMRRGEYIDEYSSESVTTRGLERHARESYNAERRDRKSSVTRAVLEEQERQRTAEDGASCCNDTDIRTASVNVSWRSIALAKAAAEWDEYVVRTDGSYEQQPVPTEEMPMSRVVSDDDVMEEDEMDLSPSSSPVPAPQLEPMEVAVPPPSPKGRHKRSVAEVYFQSYDVLGDEDENTPPTPTTHGYPEQQPTQQGYEAYYPQWEQQAYQHQGYWQSPQHAHYPQQHGCHEQYYQGDRYYSPKRSILCR